MDAFSRKSLNVEAMAISKACRATVRHKVSARCLESTHWRDKSVTLVASSTSLDVYQLEIDRAVIPTRQGIPTLRTPLLHAVRRSPAFAAQDVKYKQAAFTLCGLRSVARPGTDLDVRDVFAVLEALQMTLDTFGLQTLAFDELQRSQP